MNYEIRRELPSGWALSILLAQDEPDPQSLDSPMANALWLLNIHESLKPENYLYPGDYMDKAIEVLQGTDFWRGWGGATIVLTIPYVGATLTVFVPHEQIPSQG